MRPRSRRPRALLRAASGFEGARTLSDRSRRPVGPRRPPPDRRDGLGGDRRALRRALRPDPLAGRRGQSRRGGRADARGRGGARTASMRSAPRAALRRSSLLGREGRPLRRTRRRRGGAPRLRDRDRPAVGPCGAGFSDRAAGEPRLTFDPTTPPGSIGPGELDESVRRDFDETLVGNGRRSVPERCFADAFLRVAAAL